MKYTITEERLIKLIKKYLTSTVGEQLKPLDKWSTSIYFSNSITGKYWLGDDGKKYFWSDSSDNSLYIDTRLFRTTMSLFGLDQMYLDLLINAFKEWFNSAQDLIKIEDSSKITFVYL